MPVVARAAPVLRWSLAALMATLVLGCGIVTTGSRGPQAPRQQVDQSAMAEDEQGAVKAIDTYWQRHFTELFGQPYTSPQVAGGYVGRTGPRCGGEPSVPYNAYYCPSGDYLAWDENLMAAGYREIGDAWVYLIIAHEWGHAIQAQLDQDRVSVAAELQADCLAGAALQGAANEGLITVEPGDAEELARTLVAVADDYAWTNEQDHGDAQQRIDAFNRGANGGPKACA